MAGGGQIPFLAEEIESARESAAKFGAGEKTISAREGDRVLLVNRRVLVSLDKATGTWDATWLDGATAAVHGVGFAVEVDGRQPTPEGVIAEAAPFTDKLGTGMELRQQWGNEIVLERRLRVYDGQPAVLVSGSVTNQSDRDVRLGSVRMLDASAERGGGWFLGRMFEVPSAVGYPGASPPCRPAAGDAGLVGAAESYGSSGVVAMAYREPRCGLALGFATAREGSPHVETRFQPGQGGTGIAAASAFGGRVIAPGETVALDAVWLAVDPDPFEALEHYGDAVAAALPPSRSARGPTRCGAVGIRSAWASARRSCWPTRPIAAQHFKPLGMDVIQLDHGWQRGDVCGDWVPNERFPRGLQWLSEQLRSR